MQNKQVFLTENKLSWFFFSGLCLILALPLLNIPPWFSPPNWGKTIIFRIVFSILLFGFMWLLLFRKNIEISQRIVAVKRSLVFKLLLALLGVYFLSTIFSQDPYFSFWGSPYRSGGFLNFAFYILFAIMAYLVLQRSHWQKIWNFAFIIGIFVSLIAVFQQLGLYSDILITQTLRPASTTGNSIFLGIYLLLLSFLTFVFGIKAKRIYQKLLYFSCLGLFLFVILITITRAAYVGLIIGFLYFCFFYTFKSASRKKIIYSKIIIGTLLISGIYGIYWLDKQPKLPQFTQENPILKNIAGRIFPLERSLSNMQIRPAGWKVSMEAVKDKPILGYGPENFSIGFDKYYDSTIPYITKWNLSSGGTGWWDRAHSFVFDISVCAGIPALMIYLSIFAVLFYQLQKVKRKCPDKAIICHGIQATFIAYLVANFFSFDSFSSYIILFLLIGYCLRLINDTKNIETEIKC